MNILKVGREGVSSVSLSGEQIEEFNVSVSGSLSAPRVVSIKQARKALALAGISSGAVVAAISAIENDLERDLAKIDWETSQTVRRDSSLVVSMATALSLTDTQVDNLFIAAAEILE